MCKICYDRQLWYTKPGTVYYTIVAAQYEGFATAGNRAPNRTLPLAHQCITVHATLISKQKCCPFLDPFYLYSHHILFQTREVQKILRHPTKAGQRFTFHLKAVPKSCANTEEREQSPYTRAFQPPDISLILEKGLPVKPIGMFNVGFNKLIKLTNNICIEINFHLFQIVVWCAVL